MIFNELSLLAKPKPSASFGIYLAKIIDEMAVDNFTLRMKEKLAKKRAEGRSGWMDMSADDLSVMLRQHVDKGDPVDVANLCVFLSANYQNITPETKPVDVAAGLEQAAKFIDQRVADYIREYAYELACDEPSREAAINAAVVQLEVGDQFQIIEARSSEAKRNADDDGKTPFLRTRNHELVTVSIALKSLTGGN